MDNLDRFFNLLDRENMNFGHILYMRIKIINTRMSLYHMESVENLEKILNLNSNDFTVSVPRITFNCVLGLLFKNKYHQQ